jgi:Predicted membrane protein (DUF2207) C-terminal domain/Predicted membrane protein (DUF2207) N-terminal domain
MIWGMRSPFRTAVVVAAVLLAGVAVAAPAATKSYFAERFDSHVRVMPGGALEVTETAVFRFENGTFDHVFREIPVRGTDGIEIVGASMDGRPFPIGEGVNRIQVTGRSKVRVQWLFTSTANSAHVFVLTYVARGVVWQTDAADVLKWRALPSEHQYRIASSTIEFELPAAVGRDGAAPAPKMEWHRIDRPMAPDLGGRAEASAGPTLLARATAERIRANGWAEATFDLPRGSILTTPPAWQRAQQDAQALAPRWATAAGIIVLSGLIVLFGLRQTYDAPARDHAAMPASPAVPDALAPGLVGALLSNGRTTLEHAMATLFSLAERGIVSIEEQPAGLFGQRSFDIRSRQTRASLAGHERTLLAMTLDQARGGEAVSVHALRRRLMRRFRQFSAAVQEDLTAAGLIETDRKRVRDRYVRVSIAVLALAGLGVLGAAATLVNRYGAWPMLVPAAFALVGMVGLIFAMATTPLSNEGLRRAARWRGFRSYLKALSQDRQQPAATGVELLLPFAVATGLAANWARYLKRHPGNVPVWFRALSPATQHTAFAAFVTSTSATHGGSHGAAAAGGGSSGAG